MMMYFEFNEERLKQNNLTQEQCFSVIDKVMNEYSVYANQPGTYIASDESGFNAFSILKCMSIPWWRSHPIHENRATESI